MEDAHQPRDEELDGAHGDGSRRAAERLVRRRSVVAMAAVGLVDVLVGACLGRPNGGDGGATETSTDAGTPAATTTESPTDARVLAERFAPDIYFDRDERWFPTDPREFVVVDDGGVPTVRGFDALGEYVSAFDEAGEPPFPTVFYHVVSLTSRLSVVQYWFYSVFDQFTTNFHWHDWEVLYVWVDTADEEPTPVLYVGSAHARSMPNNEYLDPPAADVSVIAELGSHSSAIGVNRTRNRFERHAVDDEPADVTNAPIAAVAGAKGLPLAYGLPRGEGLTLPYVVPTLDGDLLFERDDLRELGVTADDFLPESLAVDTLADLSRPPSTFPPRRDGLVFSFERGDVEYALRPIDEVAHIQAFTGPQLSFPFAIPDFVEDRIAHHISAAGFPWSGADDQRRFVEPIHDVTGGNHRRELGRRYGVSLPDTGATVVAAVLAMQPDASAPENAGVVLTSLGSEVIALFESDPVAVPSSNGHVLLVGVDAGEHRLVVNGAGYAPYAQRLVVDTDLVRAGGGRLALVENADAFKLKIDAASRGGAAVVRVRDDFAGTVYDAPPVEVDGRSAVYLHRAGAYVVEVTDVAGTVSVDRVRPNGSRDSRVAGATTATGKASLVRFLVAYLQETNRDFDTELDRLVETQEERLDFGATREIGRRLTLVLAAAREADAFLEEGFPDGADRVLRTVLEQLDVVRTVSRNASDGLPTTFRRFVLRRVQEAETRTRQALALPAKR